MSASKRPRLYLKRGSRRGDGRVRQAKYFILDRGKHVATGCGPDEGARADQLLAEYIAQKYAPARKERELEAIDVADVLSVYIEDIGAGNSDTKKFSRRMERLILFWGGKTLADVTGASCRDYVESRGSDGGARRDLEDLRAAIKWHRKQGFHRGEVVVSLPEKGLPRDRWLTRQEAAKLLWVCWRAREVQRRWRGVDTGKAIETKKRPLRHLARFILIGLYTGTRAGAIATASPRRADGRSFVDLDQGVFYRLAQGRRATTKRQTPVRLPEHLLAHLRRWERLGLAKDCFVEWEGKPVKSVKTAFATAIRKAGIEHASPHSLRHTAATWLMQNGAPIWEAAGFLGMSEKMLRDTYGHHHPDHMGEAVKAFKRRRRA
jgi:integrase